MTTLYLIGRYEDDHTRDYEVIAYVHGEDVAAEWVAKLDEASGTSRYHHQAVEPFDPAEIERVLQERLEQERRDEDWRKQLKQQMRRDKRMRISPPTEYMKQLARDAEILQAEIRLARALEEGRPDDADEL
jgi:hypothetical protein